MPTINIAIKEKRATIEGAPTIICGNSDYTITFTFDSEWTSHSTKTARFSYVRDGRWQYEDSEPFSGNTVAVPVLSDITEVEVGVYGGALQTSTPARIPCKRSILCGNRHPQDPTPEVYARIMEALSAGGAEYVDPNGFILQSENDRVEIEMGDFSALTSVTVHTPGDPISSDYDSNFHFDGLYSCARLVLPDCVAYDQDGYEVRPDVSDLGGGYSVADRWKTGAKVTISFDEYAGTTVKVKRTK